METSLRLRMSDGYATVRFHPRLTPQEYAELAMRIVDTTSRAELQAEAERLASKWGKQLDFDSVLD